MSKIIRITIEVPIWKDRSIGINVGEHPNDAIVDLDIAYMEKKTNQKSYPGRWRIPVDFIRKYPAENVKDPKGGTAVTVHIVPISDIQPYLMEEEPVKKEHEIDRFVDNYNCASVLQSFLFSVKDPLDARVKKAFDYMISDDYIKLSADRKKTIKENYEKIRILAMEYEKLNNAVYEMIKSHEGLVNELSEIWGIFEYKIKETIFITSRQVGKKEFIENLREVYDRLSKIMQPLNLDGSEAKDSTDTSAQ